MDCKKKRWIDMNISLARFILRTASIGEGYRYHGGKEYRLSSGCFVEIDATWENRSLKSIIWKYFLAFWKGSFKALNWPISTTDSAY
jgi:hypothetical protein